MFENVSFWVAITVAVIVVVILAKTAVIVPQQNAYVVENLGKYSRTLHAGFHILIPFIEKSAYRHSLKEQATDIPEQVCITNDNVQVGVDGVLYLQVLDAERADVVTGKPEELGIMHVLFGDALDGSVDGGRKKKSLPLFGQFLDDGVELFGKAH